MTKISIIIPVYNSEKYIYKCLDSLKNQEFKDFEVLIIDDGSTDNSKKYIKEFLIDKRFKLFVRKHKGIGAARNFGVSKAKGDFVCFIDSDDYVDSNYLKKLYEKIYTDNLDIVVCNYIQYDKNNNFKKIKIHEFNNTTLTETPELLLWINKAPWNKMYKKEIVKSCLFPENLKYEDTEFTCKILHNSKVGYVDEYLNYYMVNPSGQTLTIDENVFSMLEILKNINKYYKNNDGLVKEYIDMISLDVLTTLTIQQRSQLDRKMANDFINAAFLYIKKNIPNYKKSKYFTYIGFLKSFIKKHKIITKIYCNVYRIIKFQK